MTTTLAAQLRQLALPSTNVLINDKRRATLLFDPKEAASISGEVIYAIGLEGLEQLTIKNNNFGQFKDTLFHITSKNFDRNIQTKEDNNKINKTIKTFLITLSPYILTNPAHKALEWLYYRYSVNDFNKLELILVGLPYYNSNIFSRIVQTLKFDDANDPFYFLKSVQKSGMHLQRLDLFYQALSNANIIKYLSKFMNELMNVHANFSILTTHFNFYCTVFCGAIEFADEIRESFISQILPLIIKGLGSTIPDFTAATYVITAKLLSKCFMSAKLLNTFLEKVSDLKCNSLKLEAALLAVLIYQLQTEYEDLPPTALHNFAEGNWLIECLQYLNASGNCIYPFLKVLVHKAIRSAIQENSPSARKLVVEVANEVEFDEGFLQTFLCSLLDSVDEDTMNDVDTNEWLRDIIKNLELKYPSNLDLAVSEVLKGKNITSAKKTFLRTLFESINESYAAKFQVLNHLYAGKDMRQETLNSVASLMKSLAINEQFLFVNVLCEKLQDRQAKVVERTLELIVKADIEKTELMRSHLMDLFKKRRLLAKKWDKVYFLAANVLLQGQEFSWEIFACLFPYITLCYERQLKEIRGLFKLGFFSKSKLFSKFNVAACSNTDELIANLLSRLDSNCNGQLLEQFLQLEATPIISRYVRMLILSHISPRKLDAASIERVFKIFNIVPKKNLSKNTAAQQGYLEMALNKKIPLQGLIDCMNKITNKAIDKQLNWSTIDLSENNGNSLFLQGLCSLAFSHRAFEAIFTSYLSNIATNNLNTKICICLNICASGAVNATVINSLMQFIAKMLNNDSKLEKNACILLLTLFTNSSDEIRSLALDLTEKLLKHCKPLDADYGWLLKQVASNKEEIIADNEYIASIFHCHIEASKKKLFMTDLLKATSSNEIPVYIKAGILKIMSQINSFELLNTFCEQFLALFKDKAAFEEYDAVILTNLISRYDLGVMPHVSVNTPIWQFAVFILNSKKFITVDSEAVFLPSMLLSQLSKDVYTVLPEDILKSFLDIMCEIAVTSEEPDVVSIAGKIFKHMDLNAKLILSLLSDMVEVQSSRASSAKAKRVAIPTVDILDTIAWKKGVCVLEFLQGKKKIKYGHLLLPLLFDILKKCLDFEEQAAVEYPKQLTLSLILLVCTKLEDENISENNFNIELVIQCIRASQNPQTHYHALLALAQAAKFVPKDVLHHVMAVFTFMGSTLIRHDDAYSFEVISKIVDTIVPILVSGNHTTTIADVLRVFVDAMLDVPEHRRIPLYTRLLNNINVKANFHLFLLLVLEAEIFQSVREKRKIEKGTASQRIEIALTLCQEFSPGITLHSCVRLAKYLNDLPDEKDEASNLRIENSLITIQNYNAKQFRHYKYLIITFLANLLSSRRFVNKVSLLSDQDNVNMEHLYKELIINVLAYIQRIQRVCEKASNTPQALYWKTVLYHSYELLDSANDLLTARMFLLVVKGLLVHSIHTVKKRALELLNNKLQNNLSGFNEQERADLYILIKPILLIIETIEQDNLQSDQETLIQTALLSLKLIVKTLGPLEPEKFVQILEFVANILKSGKARDNVLASIILCLAELCVVLRGHGISGLNSFMPAFLTVLKSQKYQETSTLLLLSVITTVNKLLDSFAAFLSPYLKKLICESSILISKWSCPSKDAKSQALVARLNNVKKKISTVIPPRILIPTIEECYNTLISKRYYNALVSLIDIMEEQLSALQFAEISPNMVELTSFFIKTLQFRCDSSSSLETANLIEDQVVKTLTVFILKLSESTFRPFYLKLYDWAVRTESSPERLITFYHLSESLGQALKGLFSLFAGNILNNLSDILRKIIGNGEETAVFDEQEKNILLLEYVLKTLRVIFTHDNKKLIDRSRFEMLMQPLVDLLEKDIDGMEELIKRNERVITPTIVHFWLAIADDSLWKEMNYQILLKMRNPSPDVRLVALHCLSEVVSKLREDFLPLLPETIPFLAELLEDEDERVERTCQKAIREMEKMLGEPLQKYF